MRLEFSPLAETDLEAIGDYIASDSPGNAPRFVRALGEQCGKKNREVPHGLCCAP
jgi:toxin ParE1/3/4